MKNHWNERYSTPGFAYGTEPNDFLTSVAHRLPLGPVLSLAEGEGRNAVYLAKLGFDVTAVDQSEVGLEKALEFACDQDVSIKTVQADLRDYVIQPNSWSAIISIFCHLPESIRVSLHSSVATGLRSGGMFVLEAYTPEQCGRGTGGPPTPDLMMSLSGLHKELAGLEFLHGCELKREVVEGRYHTGVGSVVQILASRTR
ncbi:SAM-dependent methyltransferase [Novipirellula artificiosorum]|uniref:Tellurite resistance protein TehB n=1 Tax=Novipirellula artificiosorum TaxID=2528016 RepID=A0A5C6DPW8_9BACT|nr:class I SAM-dependent methyltransferase [Novipirellula artificiosorum]TWU38275.1 tellurite resistance protein TehB [Novipirellula artificiosorum]